MAKGFGDALKKKVDLQMRELEEDKMPIFPKVDEADPGVRSMSPSKKEDYRKSIIRQFIVQSLTYYPINSEYTGPDFW